MPAFSDPTYVPDAPYDVTDRDLVADRDPASVPFPDKDPKRAYLPSVRYQGPVVDPLPALSVAYPLRMTRELQMYRLVYRFLSQ